MSDNYDKLMNSKISASDERAATPPRPPKRRGGAKRALLVLVIVLCLLALALSGAAVWGYSLSVNGLNLPNVYVDGVFVGGMTPEQTAAALRDAKWDAYEGESLTVTLPAGADFTVDYLRSGAVLSRDDAVAAACAYGHEGDVFSNLWHWLANHLRPVDVLSDDRPLDKSYLLSRIDEGVLRLDEKLNRPAYTVDQAGERLMLFKGAGGVELDTDALYQAVAEALEARRTALSFDKLRRAPSMPDFEQLWQELYVEPENAYYSESFEVVPEVVGCSFDPAAAQQLWQAAGVGEQVIVPLVLAQPELTAEMLSALLFRDVLGVQLTYYTWSTPERVNNIRLAASKLDGLILLPGETFSYNDTVGQRTVEAGFQVAKAYSDGQEVDELGGGICQVSSTLYGAALYARLKILTRQNHYFKVGYLDYGLDATVSWRQPDFRFRNDRDFPIKIAAYLNEDDESLVVEIWGTDMDGVTVRLYHTEEDVFDEELPYVLVGKSVHTYGDLYDADGNYLSTVHENSGIYYFHDEDIEWPEGYERRLGAADAYLN